MNKPTLSTYHINMARCTSYTNVESLLTGFRSGVRRSKDTFEWSWWPKGQHIIHIATDIPQLDDYLAVPLGNWGVELIEDGLDG